ncbi:hypothetical protein ACIA8O_35330 [Kitasatospora sp. NPDC051853]|uniref:hypothetical protein n=1 Tax=Kitasatospora sp. NPDC051853 TaxID=3364058 RepID=UPI0037B967DE
MEELRTGTTKPRNLTCARCNSAVEAEHAGETEGPGGRRLHTWRAGACRNPQCSEAGRWASGETR